jgi:hypothetical protein
MDVEPVADMDKLAPIAETSGQPAAARSVHVAHFRQILLWPVYLFQTGADPYIHDHAGAFARIPGSSWREIEDEFTLDPENFQERHYNEFVTFLPAVQRFLYGQKQEKKPNSTGGATPVRVMRRSDITGVRVTLAQGASPILLKVSHIDLYFFYDIDVVMLAFEVCAENIALAEAEEIMFRFGRAYPGFWEKDGRPGHCPSRVEWLAASGEVLAASDFEARSKYLAHVCEHRTAKVGAHWEFLLNPLLPRYSPQSSSLRYLQLESYRMPLMAFLAFDNPDNLTQADYVRLALANGSGGWAQLPMAERRLDEFERMYCYDRYFDDRPGDDWSGMRYMSCGRAFVVTGSARDPLFVDAEHGVLCAFRHQHFLLFMIAHFHRAALLMFSDRLAEAVNQLDASDPEAVRTFRAATRRAHETFLRFTHRYWFYAVSPQDQAHDLFSLCRRHLDLDQLYEDIRQEVEDMSQYLDTEVARRQNDSVVRLTVVTAVGLIGTVATGFLGMNLFNHTEYDAVTKFGIFALVFIPTSILVLYAIAKSQRLFEFLDVLANERKHWRAKVQAFAAIWRRR